MTILDQIAIKYGADKGPNWHNYTCFYSLFFEPIREIVKSILEIGVWPLGFTELSLKGKEAPSMRMWKEYFPNAQIHGIDIRPDCMAMAGDRVNIWIGSQSDEMFLVDVARDAGMFDIIIDDGSHTPSDQATSFRTLFNYVKPGGYYVIEDTFASYAHGLPQEFDIMKTVKEMIDNVNMHGRTQIGDKNRALTELANATLTDFERTIEAVFVSLNTAIIKKTQLPTTAETGLFYSHRLPR